MRRAALILLAVLIGLVWSAPASASYKAKVSGGKLTLTGNSKGDKLQLRLKKGAKATLQVDVGANGSTDFSFARSRFSQIIVNAGGGNDTVTISDRYGAFTTQEITKLNGATGADRLTGGAGAETLTGGPGNDIAAGAGGSDVFVWNPGDGSDRIDGAAGADALSVGGTAGSDTILVNAVGSRVVVSAPGGVLDVGTVEAVDVNTLGGNDSISGGSVAALTTLDLDGGDGNDTLNGGNGSDVLTGGLGNDVVDGNAGIDTVFLSAGDDSAVWDPGDGSDVIDGFTGADTLRFNGAAAAEVFDLFALGSSLILTRNLGNITMDVTGVETVELLPLGGADNATIGELGPTDVTLVNVDLGVSAAGDSAADAVTVEGTSGTDVVAAAAVGPTVQVTGVGTQVNLLNTESVIDRLTVAGFEGGDTLSGGALASLIALTLDGGDGNDVLNGSNGSDLLLGGDDADTIDGNAGADVFLLGAGNDTAVWDPGDASDIVEGQDGHDVLRFNGAAASEVFTANANGARLQFTRDLGIIFMDTDDVEELDLNALGGADSVTINDLASTDVRWVDLNLGSDAFADSVVVNGTAAADVMSITGGAGSFTLASPLLTLAVTGSEPLLDTLTVNLLGGADQVGASSLASTSTRLTVNAGNDGDAVIGSQGDDALNGNAGSDYLNGDNGNDTLNGGTESDYCDGGPGIDTAVSMTCETIVNIEIIA